MNPGAMLLSGEGVVSALDKLIAMVPKAFTLIGTLITSMLDVDVFALYWAVGIIGVGCGLIWTLRGTAKGS